MTKIYTLITLGTLLFLVQCKGIQFTRNTPFKINSALYNYWAGGVKGVKGIRIEIKGSLKYPSNIEFKQLYFRHHISSIKTTYTNNIFILNGIINTSKREDRIITMHKDPIKEYGNPVPKTISFPFKLKDNEAVISYLKKDKIYYLKIVDVKEGKNQYFP